MRRGGFRPMPPRPHGRRIFQVVASYENIAVSEAIYNEQESMRRTFAQVEALSKGES